jgi:DNA-damage-inducible protein D
MLIWVMKKNSIIPSAPHKNFEGIKKIDKDGVEYWEARELMPILGYEEWRKFEGVIRKAKEACSKSKQNLKHHFGDADKMIKIAKGRHTEATRRIKDYKLSRYACYLIAQNGDPRKKEIAAAQTYFAVQTRRQEIYQQLGEDAKRLFIREEVRKQNKQLFSTARKAGVKNFGKFNNMGYLGLYGMSLPKLKKKKGIGKDDVLDRAGATELAANLFRITQTDDKIRKDEIRGEGRAAMTHYSVGTKVRKTIEEIGGQMPENLPSEKHVKRIAKRDNVKRLK